jgi:2-methylisocitrate lyase-like PEP mutase family enzyme
VLAITSEVLHNRGMREDERRRRFHDLHVSGTFLMPNPHDLGSCRLLSELGFEALATTSGGLAASLGRRDMSVSRDQLVEHVTSLCAATDLPVNVDAEQCFPASPGGIEATVALLAEAGAAGCSIEDWDPDDACVEAVGLPTERVALAASVARLHGMVLTARAENHLHGRSDLDDTIARLRAYANAGAHVVYAPGLVAPEDIARAVAESGAPLNVLVVPGGPSADQLGGLGVRRLSVGSSLARIAYGALVRAAEALRGTGVLDPDAPYLPRALAESAFIEDR